MKYTMPYAGQWLEFTDEDLAVLEQTGKTAVAAELREEHRTWRENKLSRFLAHGIPRRDKPAIYAEGAIVIPPSVYPAKYPNDGTAFLNDWTSEILLYQGPRSCGKTVIGCIKACLFSLNCDPAWPIFTRHGIEYREWHGPQTILVASLNFDTLAQVWGVYREFLPRDELGPYAPDWGTRPGEHGQPKDLSFKGFRSKRLRTYKSGTSFVFCSYTQRTGTWENIKTVACQADEQITGDKHRAWSDGARIGASYTPLWVTLSGFRIRERPDTGMAGYVYQNIVRQNRTGRTVSLYYNDIQSTPDAIVSAHKKAEIYRQYADPKVPRDRATANRGLAVYWPGWEPAGGLVIKEWDRAIHMIPQVFPDGKPPADWTLYRMLDYGTATGTNACLWIAMSPPGFTYQGITFKRSIAIVYDCLYETGYEIADVVREVIKRSGNIQTETGEYNDPVTQATYKCYREDFTGSAFFSTKLDSRSFAESQMGTTIGQLFRRYGLISAQPAPGTMRIKTQNQASALMILGDWLRIDPEEPHLVNRTPEGKSIMGAPRLYVVGEKCRPLVNEIETLAEDDDRPGQIKPKQADHAIACLFYFVTDRVGYYGDAFKGDGHLSGNKDRKRTPYTGL